MILAMSLLIATAPPDPAWLAGTWLHVVEAADRDLIACASGLPIVYAPDGTYALFEESGTWRLEGDRLTETATAAHEDMVAPEEVAIGVPFVSRVERVGPDEMRKTDAGGRTETLLRCPAAP